MNWIQRLLGIRAPQMEPGESQILARLMPRHGVDLAPRSYRGLLEAYSTSPWVRAAVGKIGDMVGSTQWYLFGVRGRSSGKFHSMKELNIRRDGSLDGLRKALSDNVSNLDLELVPIIEHPMLRLLNGSNPIYPGYVGRSLTEICLTLTGEAYWVLDPIEGTVPESYWIMPPHWVTEMPRTSSPTWKLETPQTNFELPIGSVIRFVTPDPLNPYGRGSGHMKAFGDEIDAYEYSSKHIRAWFQNRAIPDIVVSGPDLDMKQAALLENTWISKLRSFTKAHRPFFLKGDGINIKELSQKFTDMEMSQLRKDDRDTIIHGLGLPPEIFGILESSNRSTITAAAHHMALYVTVPRLELQRTFMQEFLVPIYDDRLLLAYESPVQEDNEFRLEVMKSNPVSFRTSDWRELAGMEPPEDQDNVYVIPFNVNTAVTLAPAPPPVDQIQAAVTAALRLHDERLQNKPLERSEPEHDESCGCGAEDARAAAKLEDGGVPGVVDEIVSRIATILTKAGVGGDDTARLALKLNAEMQKETIAAWEALRNELDLRTIQQALESGDIESVISLLDDSAVDAAFADAVATLKEAVVIVGTESAAELSEFISSGISFELTNPEAVAALEELAAGMVTNVSDETIAAIRQALVDAYSNGRTGSQAARDIREMLGLTTRDAKALSKIVAAMTEEGASAEAISKYTAKWVKKKVAYRAKVIAEHELNKAGNFGQEQLWKQADEAGLLPKNVKREWIVTNDDHLCELCSQMIGVTTSIGEPFSTPTGTAMTPQDIHVRCRCSERLIFEK